MMRWVTAEISARTLPLAAWVMAEWVLVGRSGRAVNAGGRPSESVDFLHYSHGREARGSLASAAKWRYTRKFQ
ncbi:hypothetical protein MYF61_29775, partial [Klebsiella quasipneumoniae]|uniref:hypothetical protein n=1 Tax=Klebsiella quasipneumoniae TaxID=1463165 RepID=UPI0020334257